MHRSILPLVTLLAATLLPAATLSDLFGDCTNTGCTANGCPIELRILDRGSGTYQHPPANVITAVTSAVSLLLAGDISGAGAAAATGGYKVTPFVDALSSRSLEILEPQGPQNPGYGYFIFDLSGDRRTVIEAPHVGFDTATADFAIVLFDRLRAAALLIPGADRYTNATCNGCSPPCTPMPGKDEADVTRTTLNLFHKVHEQLLQDLGTCRELLVIQPHGFGQATESRPGCGHHFILSDGRASRPADPEHLVAVGDALARHSLDGTGTTPYTYNIATNQAGDCPELTATHNQQGATTRAASHLFVSMEMASSVRAFPDASDTAEVGMGLLESRREDIVTGAGAGPGNPNRVRLYDAAGLPTPVDFLAYQAGTYGVNATAAALDAGYDDEILTGPGPGPVFGPQVRAFDRTGTPLSRINYFAYGTLRYGVRATGGDLDLIPNEEMLTGAGPGDVFGPHVRAFRFDGSKVLAMAKISFFAYKTLRYGVNDTPAQLDADCFREILTGPGPGTIFGPQIRGFNQDGGSVTAISRVNFNAFPTGSFGATVAGGSMDRDDYDELVTGKGAGPALAAVVRAFNYDASTVAALPGFDATPYVTLFGARVGAGLLEGKAPEDLLTGPGPDPAALSMVASFGYDGTGLTPLVPGFEAMPGTAYGVHVASGRDRY